MMSLDLVEKEIHEYNYGDPFDVKTKLGSMARRDLRAELQNQVDRSVKQGARCVIGGKIPEGQGAFYPATLLINVTPGMTAFDDEMFGPVVCITKASDETEAIAMANLSSFGLGGGIFSNDTQKALRIASEHLETGGVFINECLRSDPRLPFGGIKDSGYGRELSYLGIKEFVNAKTVHLK